jgi:hypothetical protein
MSFWLPFRVSRKAPAGQAAPERQKPTCNAASPSQEPGRWPNPHDGWRAPGPATLCSIETEAQASCARGLWRRCLMPPPRPRDRLRKARTLCGRGPLDAADHFKTLLAQRACALRSLARPGLGSLPGKALADVASLPPEPRATPRTRCQRATSGLTHPSPSLLRALRPTQRLRRKRHATARTPPPRTLPSPPPTKGAP